MIVINAKTMSEDDFSELLSDVFWDNIRISYDGIVGYDDFRDSLIRELYDD